MERARRLQPCHPRHRDVEDRQVDIGHERAPQRFRAVSGLGQHLEVGLSVEHEPQAAAHDRVIVGQQDAGLQRSHRASPIS